MKRYYRTRFIGAAMLAFFLLLILTISGIWYLSYHQMEQDTDNFMQAMQAIDQNSAPEFRQSAPPPMFGYTPDQRRYPSGFYDIIMTGDGTVQEINQRGIIEDAGINVQQYVQQAVSEKSPHGKIGSYKYQISFREDGTARMILLDISIQLQALYNTQRSSLLVGGGLLLLWLLILVPVSSRVADMFLRNAEKQKQFITDAGHDLKTPIAIIRSNLDVMELMQGKSNWSDNIRDQIKRLEHLVSQLIMMARLEETSVTRAKTFVDFSNLLREQLAAYKPLADEKNLIIISEITDHLNMKGEEESLRQMISLLLDNAVQYTSESGQITVKADSQKKKLRFTVYNTVNRFPEQSPEELIGRFVRGESSRSQKSGGAGIGLSAVQRIVDIHRGKLEIDYQDHNQFVIQIDM